MFVKEKLIESNCPSHRGNELFETVSRRIGMPLYIPLLSLISSFLLFSKRNKKYNFFDKYIYGFYGFIVLIFAEILVRYSGFSLTNASLYFLLPLLMSPIVYFYLLTKIKLKSMRIVNQYLIYNFLKVIGNAILLFICLGVVFNLFEEIEFLNN